MPQENVKEIALREITEKFKTKLSMSLPWPDFPMYETLLPLPMGCFASCAIVCPYDASSASSKGNGTEK
jgi:hypothetical protein